MELPKRFLLLLKTRSFATWSTYVAKSLSVLFLPPFIFATFSSEEAAVWLVFITLQGMQLLIAASTDQPIVRGLAYALGGATQVRDMREVEASTQRSTNMKLFSQVWAVSNLAHLVIGIATLALLTVIGIWSAAPLIAKTQAEVLWIALGVFVLGGAIRAHGGRHVSYLIGVDRICLLRWWETGFWLLAFFAALSVLLIGGNLLSIALAYQIPLILNTFWNASLCKQDQRTREGFIISIEADREIVGQLWPSMWRTGVGTTLYLGATQGGGLYYATVGEAQDVAAFLFAMSLIRPLGQFAQVPFMTKLPRLARLQAEGKRSVQLLIAQQSMFLSYVLHATMIIMVALALPVLIRLSESEVEVPALLWLLIGLAGYLERMGSMHLQLYAITNHVLFHLANGLSSFLYIGVAIFLVKLLDVYAFPVAQIMAMMIAYIPIGMWNSYRNFKFKIPEFEIKTSIPPLSIILLAIIFSHDIFNIK